MDIIRVFLLVVAAVLLGVPGLDTLQKGDYWAMTAILFVALSLILYAVKKWFNLSVAILLDLGLACGAVKAGISGNREGLFILLLLIALVMWRGMVGEKRGASRR